MQTAPGSSAPTSFDVAGALAERAAPCGRLSETQDYRRSLSCSAVVTSTQVLCGSRDGDEIFSLNSSRRRARMDQETHDRCEREAFLLSAIARVSLY
jgi:hypothetical protein